MKPVTMILDPAECERMPPGGGKAACLGPERSLLEAAFFDQIISSMVKARAQRFTERAATRPSLVPVSRN
jgi:hypothetical protein